jgi:hypothetical protein
VSIPSYLPRPIQQEEGPTTLQVLLDAAERRFIVRALEENGGSRKRAAAQLGVSRSTLFNKMRKHHLLDKSGSNGRHEEAADEAPQEPQAPPVSRSALSPLYVRTPPTARYG